MARYKIDLVSASTENKRKHSVYLTIGFIFSEILRKKNRIHLILIQRHAQYFEGRQDEPNKTKTKKNCKRMKNWCKSVFRASELKYLSMALCETRDFF